MFDAPLKTDVMDKDEPVFSISEVSELLTLLETKVKQMIKDNYILAVIDEGKILIPRVFFNSTHSEIAAHLPGLISVLKDGGYSNTDVLRWLFSLSDVTDGQKPIRYIDALHTDYAREVKRRAQALGF